MKLTDNFRQQIGRRHPPLSAHSTSHSSTSHSLDCRGSPTKAGPSPDKGAVFGMLVIAQEVLGCLSIDLGPSPIGISSNDAAVPMGHAPHHRGAVMRPQGQGTFVTFPQACTVAALVLKNWMGWSPKFLNYYCLGSRIYTKVGTYIA